MVTISINKDYSKSPGLRHCEISEHSGEDFYHRILNPNFEEAYRTKTKLVVDLDGTQGYAPSFLDESFGNLVYDFSLESVRKYLEIISHEEPHWKDMIEKDTFVKWEKRRTEGQSPKKTEIHSSWFRLEKGSLKQEQWGK